MVFDNLKHLASARIAGLIVLVVAVAGCGGGSSSSGSSQTIQIGLVAAQTGPNAVQGQSLKLGAMLAIKDINANGGIKALGGAKLELVTQDAGTTDSDAVSAVESMLAAHNVVATIGAGISSQDLAMSQVTEQHKIPLLDTTFADALTTRGFKYIFILPPPQSKFDSIQYPTLEQLTSAAGVKLTRVGILGSLNATNQLSAQHIEQIYAPQYGWQIVMNEFVQVGTMVGAPLAAIVSKIQATKPQVLLIGSSVPDVTNIQRLELAQGMTPVPWLLNGAPYLSQPFLDGLGVAGTQGVVVVSSAAPTPANKTIANEISAAGQIPMQFNLGSYSIVNIVAQAMENAKSSDTTKIRDAISALNLHGGPGAAAWPCDCLQFDSTGRASTASVALVQWQGGKPVTVYPASIATGKLIWTGS